MLGYRYPPRTIARTIPQVIERILEVAGATRRQLDYNSELWRELSRQIKIRDRYKCVSCHDNHHLEVHHVVPIRSGGTNDPSNLRTLCSRCHHVRHQGQLKKENYGQRYYPANP